MAEQPAPTTAPAVTSIMAEAGAALVWAELGTLGPKMGQMFNAAEFASRVYTTMRTLEAPPPRPAQALVLKLDTAELQKDLRTFTEAVVRLESMLAAVEPAEGQ